jgi:hypothetical protein
MIWYDMNEGWDGMRLCGCPPLQAELERQRQDKLRATAKAAEEGVLQTRFLQSMQARQKKVSL